MSAIIMHFPAPDYRIHAEIYKSGGYRASSTRGQEWVFVIDNGYCEQVGVAKTWKRALRRALDLVQWERDERAKFQAKQGTSLVADGAGER